MSQGRSEVGDQTERKDRKGKERHSTWVGMISDLEPVSLYIMSNLWCMDKPNVDKIGVVGHHHKPL